ncbi:MAG: leucine--tRNA ligase [Candidatus Dadabacteria bacterium]|nr:MAG: leucine--tRNA ligase [Candidatus Dadabacteria bacterium]
MAYDPKKIEPKWQKFWEENSTFKTPQLPGEKKLYCLDMFPYPSGEGLHIGHPLGYTASDIFTRFKRMQGYTTLHPMGYDAFGLPAEQHAINTGEHPAKATAKNCERFTKQLKSIGYSYDWSREIRTCDPSYYRWTQWIFLKIYNSWFDEEAQKARPIEELPIPDEIKAQGEKAILDYQAQFRLAYYGEAMVNWCPALGTVLANEEVINGRSERGGHEVFRKPMKQWMLRITKYADRLLKELDFLDWPESIKEQQRNWIGRKEGANIKFKIEGLDEYFTAFTTRPDTLFGVTFFVISPEHPLVEKVTKPKYKAAVEEYQKKAATLSELDRTLETREKTGVFTGSYVINPITEEPVPLYIADYVLMSYGTGAVMGVPAHDERDFEFARKFQIPIKPVICPINADKETVSKVSAGEIPWIEEGVMFDIPYPIAIQLDLQGLPNKEAAERIVNWLKENNLGEKTVNYKLRDWVFSRQRYWGEPIPIIHWEDGRITALKEEELPLLLPEVPDYKPAEGGESPLAKATSWLYVEDKERGIRGRRETNTMPQWAGSCWYYLRFIDPHNDKAPWDREKERAWMPVDLYIGGAEHAVLHLLYARFWHKILYDLGYVSTIEPFQKLYNQGMILSFAYKDKRGALVPVDKVKETEDGRAFHIETREPLEKITAKMSKSLKNVVNPEVVVSEYGADSLRLYMMFRGPINTSGIYDTQAIVGVYRFLKRVWTLITEDKESGFTKVVLESEEPEEVKRAINLAVKKVTEDLEGLRFNTAVAALMTCYNELNKHKKFSKATLETFLKLLSPFAPHISEELWERLGNKPSISKTPWPSYDAEYIKTDKATVVVQVKGKKRAVIEVEKKISEDELIKEVVTVLANTPYKVTSSDKIITVYTKDKSPKLVNIIPQ